MAIKKAAAESKCLICKIRKTWSRGICQPCNRDVQELVRIEKVTEDDLMNRGLLLPSKTPGRKIKPSPLLTKLAKVNGKRK